MKTNTIVLDYKGFRFPREIICHAVWLYFRFSLSFRDGEELLARPDLCEHVPAEKYIHALNENAYLEDPEIVLKALYMRAWHVNSISSSQEATMKISL